jgi:hypothetical protein
MKLILAGLLFYSLFKGDYFLAAATLTAITLSLIPSILERNHNATLPWELDFLITLALFFHTFFGEWLRFYDNLWFFDKIMHLYGTSLIAILAFMIVYTLHATRKLRLTLPFMGLFTVTFSMAIGGLWEIGEFTFDKTFGKNTQYGLDNTMWDLVSNLMGGIFIAFLGMIYVKFSRPEGRKRITMTVGEVFSIKKGRH